MTIHLQKILLPTDFSRNSLAAVKYACELAVKFNAELHVLHILESHPSMTPEFGMGVVLQKNVEESTKIAEKSLREAVTSESVGGQNVVHVLLHGSPKAEIVRYAAENEIDLIVISTHGRKGVSHLILGSVAEHIVRTASCPVLTVRGEAT